MAFGTWMKRISNGVKSFGKKVKKVAEKALPVLQKGAKFLADKGGQFVEDLGESLGNDTLVTIGKGAKKLGNNANKWIDRGNRMLKPD